MRSILLPNGNLLVPVDAEDPEGGEGFAEIGPEHPDYGKWLPFAEEREDPRGGGQQSHGDRARCVRRDSELHRGRLLRLLGLASFLMSLAAPVLLYAGCAGLALTFPLASKRAIPLLACSLLCAELGNLVLGLTVAVASRRDLKKMRAGLMDPQGRGATRRARDSAEDAVVLIVACLCLLVLFWYGSRLR